MTQVISKKDLLSWLNQLTNEYRLIAPVSTEGLILFQQISRVEDIVLHFNNTVLSPKEWFFPTTETLFAVERKDEQTELISASVDHKTVIFGLRPCDAKGIAVLDKAFLAEPTDTLYQQHRDKTTLIGLSCSQAGPECFCTSIGTAPNDPSHVDILLSEVEEGYVIQIVTRKGEALLSGVPVTESKVTLPPPPSLQAIPTEGIEEVMQEVFNAPYWSRLADRCIHCNLCAYVCPTCYCFDIRDYVNKGKIERVRTWESCQSAGFTRLAGGYNPRSTKEARLRQRFYHKLLYFPQQFGDLGCVGCGRCIRSCPVNIDIQEIITDVQKLGTKSVI